MPTKLPATVLLDTNCLLRLVTTASPLHTVVVSALKRLAFHNIEIYVCPQNLQEFRQVATRPEAANGFGWTSAQTALAMNRIESDFVVLQETPNIYPLWRTIVETVQAAGRANFDARIVAVAQANCIEAVMTFEVAAFARYGQIASVLILDPSSI